MTGTTSDYGLRIDLALPYEQAIKKVTEALQSEGFGILTEIDVRATLKKKLDVDFQKYVILGACNPQLAHRALTSEMEIGLLLPCNVIVYEENGGSVISLVDPIAMMGVAQSHDLASIADEARQRLLRVQKALASE